MTRRELARLLPLLALYVLAWAVFPSLPDDEASYVTLAERLTHGTYTTGDVDALLDDDPASPDLWFGPGLPAAVVPLVALDLPLSAIRLVGPLFLFAAVVLFYALVRDRLGERPAFAAAYGLGLYPPFWALLSNLHSEALALLFVAMAMLGVERYLRSGRATSFGLGAVGLAGLALTRVAYGWVLTIALVVLTLWWLTTRSRVARRVVPVLAAALLLCVPWLAYTYAKTDRPFVWGNSGSLSLYWMSSPHPGDRGDWRQANDVFTDPALAPHRAFFARLRGMSLAEQNAEIEREALHNIVDHPLSYIGNLGANLSRMLLNRPYSDSDWKPNDLFYAVPNLLVAAIVIGILTVLVPRRRRLPEEAVPFAVLASIGFVLHLAVATYPRMLMPLVPFVAWFATFAVVQLRGLSRVGPPDDPRRTRPPTGIA